MRREFSFGTIKLINACREDLFKSNKKIAVKKSDMKPTTFFLHKLFDLYQRNDKFLDYRGKCNNYFETIINVLQNLEIEEIKDFADYYKLIIFFIDQFKSLKIYERTQNDHDYLLEGLLKMFECFIHLNVNNKKFFLEDENFLNVLMFPSLFETPSGLNNKKNIIVVQYLDF